MHVYLLHVHWLWLQSSQHQMHLEVFPRIPVIPLSLCASFCHVASNVSWMRRKATLAITSVHLMRQLELQCTFFIHFDHKKNLIVYIDYWFFIFYLWICTSRPYHFASSNTSSRFKFKCYLNLHIN